MSGNHNSDKESPEGQESPKDRVGTKAIDDNAESRADKRARYLLPLLGTLTVAALTVYVDHAVSKRAEKANNARLATELFSRREQAESELRKDMFGTILRSFLDEENGTTRAADLPDRLLKLELLALNFGESLSLGPLFQEINRQILTPASYKQDPDNMLLDQADYMGRLERLARRVSDRQVAAFMGAGLTKNTFDITVPLDQVSNEEVYQWPDDSVKYQYPSPDFDDADREDMIKRTSCLQLNGVVRQVAVTLSEASQEMKTLSVKLDIDTTKPKPESSMACLKAMQNYCEQPLPVGCESEITIEQGEPFGFTLDRFNFPMIDNALLSNNQRFATIMRKFTPDSNGEAGSIELKGVLFPGEYASLRDKPQLNQAIDHLRESMPDAEE